MPYFDTLGNRVEVTYSSGRTYLSHSPMESPEYSNISVSDGLKTFLRDVCDTCGSSSPMYFRYYLLGHLDSQTTKILNNVFSKINSICESDDGYVIINNNQKMKLGKLIVKVGDEIKINTDSKSEAISIEQIVDQYKSWFKSISSLRFKILKGEQILKGYDRHYQSRNGGMLSGSCMNDKPELLNLYVDNEEKVELLTLVDNNDKIHGRAFLWKVDNRPYVFMDRVYGVDNYIVNIFHSYAKSQKMIYREQQQLYNFGLYLPNGTETNSIKYPLKVKLYSQHLQYMPYMDSLYIWNKWGSTFSTSKTEVFMKFHCLKSTWGKIGRPGIKILGIKLKNDD